MSLDETFPARLVLLLPRHLMFEVGQTPHALLSELLFVILVQTRVLLAVIYSNP